MKKDKIIHKIIKYNEPGDKRLTWGIKDYVGYKGNQPWGAVKIPLISRGVEHLTCQR